MDPSEQNILVLCPAAATARATRITPQRRLPTDRPVDGITDMLIDGDIYVAENGAVARVIPAAGWKAQPPGDTRLRPTSRYTLLSSPDRADGTSSRRKGILYAFDAENHRVVAFNKSDGAYVAQYQLAGGDDAWAGLRGMTVMVSPDETVPPTMWWISDTGLHAVSLAAAPDAVSRSLAVPEPRAVGRSLEDPEADADPEADPDPEAVTRGVRR